MLTHQLTWAGELARHDIFLQHRDIRAERVAAMPPSRAKFLGTSAIVRARVLHALSDGRPHKRADIDARMVGVDCGRGTIRKAIYELQRCNVIIGRGSTTNRAWQLR